MHEKYTKFDLREERHLCYIICHILHVKIKTAFLKRSGKREKKITQKREENKKIEKNCLFNTPQLFWLTGYYTVAEKSGKVSKY